MIIKYIIKKLMNENMIIKYIIKKLYRLMVPQMTMTSLLLINIK